MIKQILVLAIIGLSLGFRLFYVSHFNFAFTIDQAHDILEIRRLAVGHEIVFLGPSTSLNGVYYGPFWFYYNLPAFILGRGDPTVLVYWEIIFYALVVLIFFLYFRKKLPHFAFLFVVLLLLSPRLFGATSYALNSNTSPAFILLFITFLYRSLQNINSKSVFILGLLAGICLQIEAFGVLMLPLGIFWLFRYKVKKLYLYFLAFFLTLIPQILFEIKHNFLMTKVFLSEFSGHGNILGDKINLPQKIVDRFQHYIGELGGSFSFPHYTGLIFLQIIFLYIITRPRSKKENSSSNLLLNLNLSLLLISVLFFLVYPNRLKDWMTINFVIPYLLIFSIGIATIWDTKKFIFRLPVVIILSFAIIGGISFYNSKLIEKLHVRSNDPGSLGNQIDAVDWVYQNAKGDGFKVYDYNPAVYDFNYQYLFWWYGSKTYSYQPISITYQDNVPVYIETLPKYQLNIRQNDQPVIFLIKEGRPGFEEEEAAWRHQFDGLCKMDEIGLTGNIVVEKLIKCHEKK